MTKRTIFSQFAGAFIRQLGRESAHDVYNDVSGKNTRHKIVGSEDATLAVPGFWKYVYICIVSLFPCVSLVLFVKGIKRIFTKNIIYHFYTIENIYKTDGRYRGGARIVGETKVEQKFTRPIDECPETDITRFRLHAFMYLIIALCSFTLKFYGYEQLKNFYAEEEIKYTELAQKVTQWNIYQLKDDFSEETREFWYVYPTKDSKLCTDIVLIKENKLFFYTTSSLYISSFDKPELKVFKDGEFSFISVEMSREFLEKKDKITMDIDGEHSYSYRYFLPTKESKIISQSDSFHIRIDDKVYKFNNINPIN